jgi:bHLH factor
VQYIHHLKENEARNIEKWTLEKLLMDQAMGDLQTQLEEIKRFYEEERNIRQRLENELQGLRSGLHSIQMSGGVQQVQGQGMGGKDVESLKRDAVEGGEGDRDGKRQRTE